MMIVKNKIPHLKRKMSRGASWLLLLFLPVTSSCQQRSMPTFNQDLAFEQLKVQCAFGARVPGSAAHLSCKNYLVTTLKKYADQVTEQPFRLALKPGMSPATCYNIIANFHPQKTRRLLLCAHWDTRPWADQDPNPANHQQPVLGASDGASGVAVLLELARLLKQAEPNFGIDIVFFDAEDFGQYGRNDSWALGSKQFAQQLTRRYHPEFAILLDLIGDADQQIYIEKNSQQYAPEIVKQVWDTAKYLGITEFIPEVKHDVYDDHLNLLAIGIRCIDIIDFDYLYWHTVEDTPDKCSPQSLGNIGRVLVQILYQ